MNRGWHIHERIDHARHDHGCKNVCYRVLLQEHGGQDDEPRQHEGCRLYPPLFPESVAVADSKGGAQRVKDMDAGQHIGGCICLVQPSHCVCKYIIPRKDLRGADYLAEKVEDILKIVK